MITLILAKTEEVAVGTTTFFFIKPENFSFLPGQYVAMKLMDELLAPDQRGPVRSLSISSAPHEDFLAFTLRYSDSGFKQTLWSLVPGATVMITPPVGKFVLEEGDVRPAVFLVGGVGITPVRSMLCEAVEKENERRMILLYANRTLADAPFAAELRAMPLKNLRYIDVLSQEEKPSQGPLDERGYIDQFQLQKQVDNPGECVYYIVGSPSFITAMETLLDTLGVAKEQRHKDPFTGLGSINPALVR